MRKCNRGRPAFLFEVGVQGQIRASVLTDQLRERLRWQLLNGLKWILRPCTGSKVQLPL